MRLIARFSEEREAFHFSCFLQGQQIESRYEPYIDSATGCIDYQVWVVDEDQFEQAVDWERQFRAHPHDARFQQRVERPSSSNPETEAQVRVALESKRRSPLTLTNLLIALCALLFFWNSMEEAKILDSKGLLMLQLELTEIQQEMLFDYPKHFQEVQALLQDVDLKGYKGLEELPLELQARLKQADAIPYWEGVVAVVEQWREKGWSYLRAVPLFERIREGELWRLFTPCLLHRDLLHILFNMAWLFVLGRQIEERLRKGRMLLLVLVIGVVSNMAQYLMGGPYFLGFSGVVVGMVGYIWMRQRLAPWEGYPLTRPVIFFVALFVGAMFALEIFSWILQYLGVTQHAPNIANTAHIVGGLTGVILAKTPLFSRPRS